MDQGASRGLITLVSRGGGPESAILLTKMSSFVICKACSMSCAARNAKAQEVEAEGVRASSDLFAG